MKILITSIVALAIISNCAWSQTAQPESGSASKSENAIGTDAAQTAAAAEAQAKNTTDPSAESTKDQDLLYICPMVCVPPSTEPGKCPVCGMNLNAQPESGSASKSENAIGTDDAQTAAAAEAQAKSDKLHIAVQAICPVSGQKLGSMGDPIKIKVEKEHVFLCCKGCLDGEIDLNHWKTIQANLVKAQGICPVMGNPVSVEKQSVIVHGRKIYVCCPPCIAPIKEDPKKHIEKLDAQITAFLEAQEKEKTAGQGN